MSASRSHMLAFCFWEVQMQLLSWEQNLSVHFWLHCLLLFCPNQPSYLNFIQLWSFPFFVWHWPWKGKEKMLERFYLFGLCCAQRRAVTVQFYARHHHNKAHYCGCQSNLRWVIAISWSVLWFKSKSVITEMTQRMWFLHDILLSRHPEFACG